MPRSNATATRSPPPHSTTCTAFATATTSSSSTAKTSTPGAAPTTTGRTPPTSTSSTCGACSGTSSRTLTAHWRRELGGVELVGAGFGLCDAAVELGEGLGPRLRVAEVDAERGEQILRRARSAGTEEIEVGGHELLRIL